MGQTIIKLLSAVGAGAAVFYAIGFVAVQSFVYNNGFEGMFWLTGTFYQDAGANFLLELVRAPLLAWYVFFPYLLLLYVLAPEGKLLPLGTRRWTPAGAFQWARVLALFAIMALTYLFAMSYDDVLGSRTGTWFVDHVFQDPTDSGSPQTKQSQAFFSVVAPMVVVVAVFLHRFRTRQKLDPGKRAFYALALAGYLVFLAIIPIAYGMHLYDWRIIPVNVASAASDRADANDSGSHAWLLGEFGNRYVFLKKADISSQGVIEAVPVADVHQLSLDFVRSESLKSKRPVTVQQPALVSEISVRERIFEKLSP